MSLPDNTGAKQGSQLWKPGQSGNPAGRPRGSRNALSAAFLTDVHVAWQAHGKQAILDVLKDDPAVFLKVVASLVPKELLLAERTETSCVIRAPAVCATEEEWLNLYAPKPKMVELPLAPTPKNGNGGGHDGH
jgi:Family of unknown function (DUF5681)